MPKIMHSTSLALGGHADLLSPDVLGRCLRGSRALTVGNAWLQVKGKWRAQYARYGNKGILVLGMLMALTGSALILGSMQQPKAAVVHSGSRTGPSRDEPKAGALQPARKAAKQKGSLTNGCPILRAPKVRPALPEA